jgi:hypothetical protein
MRQRQPRVRDPGFLAFIRKQPCVHCGQASQACHIRSGSRQHGKPSTGMQEKPSDRWCVPMCRSCHGEQHSQNELEFWKSRGVDPFALAVKLYAKYQALGGGKTTTKKPRSRTTIAPRGFPKTQRKLQSRGFR